MSEDDKENETPETEEAAPQGGTEPAAGPTGRVLDQEEIDSLLGFDAGDGNGVRELIKSAVVSYGRLPMLEVVFERLAEQAAASLRTLTSGPADVTVEGSGSIRYGAYMGSIPSPALLAIFKAREWNNFGLMAIDADLAFGLLDVLLGGQSDPPSERPDPRPYTTIERDLIGQMAKLIVEDQAAAFQTICQVGFEIDHFETNPGFANIARAGSAAIMTRFNVVIGKSRGTFDIV